MAKPYNININNGTGTVNAVDGTYSVTASANGYNNTSINPTEITVNGASTHAFTISASGTLTIHVSEDGTQSGTSVVGAKFIRCDRSGNTYGTEIETNSEGNAVFSNVPYASENAPLIFYKQTASDGSHNFSDALSQIALTSETGIVEVKNESAATQTVTLADANYSGLMIESAQLTLN